jgi:hypothetical protein
MQHARAGGARGRAADRSIAGLTQIQGKHLCFRAPATVEAVEILLFTTCSSPAFSTYSRFFIAFCLGQAFPRAVRPGHCPAPRYNPLYPPYTSTSCEPRTCAPQRFLIPTQTINNSRKCPPCGPHLLRSHELLASDGRLIRRIKAMMNHLMLGSSRGPI